MPKIALPQHDGSPATRHRELSERKNQIEFDYSVVSNVPLASSMPDESKADLAWNLKIIANSYKTRQNWEKLLANLPIVFEDDLPYKSIPEIAELLKDQDLVKILAYCDPDLGRVLSDNRPSSFDDYYKLFQYLRIPAGSTDFDNDEAFADYFVAGLNPMLIRVIEEIPTHLNLSQEFFEALPKFRGDSLAEAIHEQRLYIVDYKELSSLESGEHDGQQKYLYAPMVVLGIPKGGQDLEVISIQLDQGRGSLMVGPHHKKWDWLIAKTIVKVADANYHEVVSHLTETHLILDSIIVASFRNLSKAHPLFRLLLPHFKGTLPINTLATRVLINKGGAVESLLAMNIESVYEFIKKSRNHYDFRGSFPKANFERRGVGVGSTLTSYPYRDDALLVWDAIYDWIEFYVSHYYESDQDVADDPELASWVQETESTEGGRIKGFTQNGRLDTKKELTETLTMIIFTASAQHAAMNFPQGRSAAVPYQPLAGFAPVPAELNRSQKDALDILPPVDLAIKQTHTMSLLGSTQHTRLGGYEFNTFTDKRISLEVMKFQYRLYEIEKEIDGRNQTRRTPYPYLKPSLIPQSINI